MGNQKFTKGPWRIAGHHGQHDECGAFINGGDGKRVADTPGEIHRSYAEDEANAHLIEAAPDLYDALKTLEQLAGIASSSDDPARIRARKALAKAEGYHNDQT
jgi:hypothetical protein